MSFSMKVYASTNKPRIVLHPHAPIDKKVVKHILQALSPGEPKGSPKPLRSTKGERSEPISIAKRGARG